MSKVLKFGGKSLASLHQNNDLPDIIKNYLKTSSLIVVVSAIGSTTDLLLELLQKAKKNQSYSKELRTLKELNFYPQIDTTFHFQLIENIGRFVNSGLQLKSSGFIIGSGRINQLKSRYRIIN